MKEQNKWLQGYACALASIIKFHGHDVTHKEALGAAGLISLKSLQEAEIDEGDIEALMPVIDEIKRNEEYRHEIRKKKSNR